jgi:MinD-like ATPase involved in chromosome partitioning or flagellar assembly
LGKIIAVHSYKGGTGKTLLSVNLTATLANQGNKVALFDLDFRAPSLATILKVDKLDHWLNDYLNGTCEIDKVLLDLTENLHLNGKLYAGLANPMTEAIRDMSAKDRKWEMRALGRLLALRTSLLNDKQFDYVVFDTSPGLQYSSINAIVSADIIIVATTFDRSDVDGTQRMLRELYDLFEKKTELVLNKVFDVSSLSEKERLRERVKDAYHVPLLAAIPCYCDVLRAGGSIVFAAEKPDHPFTKILNGMAKEISNIL